MPGDCYNSVVVSCFTGYVSFSCSNTCMNRLLVWNLYLLFLFITQENKVVVANDNYPPQGCLRYPIIAVQAFKFAILNGY